MAMERTHNDPITFEIAEHLTVISKKDNGWCRELNLVSWNGQQPPKFDIRDWSPDHSKMGKGIALSAEEVEKLFWHVHATAGPQAFTLASGQYHGINYIEP